MNNEHKDTPTRESLLDTALSYAKKAESMALEKVNTKDAKTADLLLLETIRDSIIFIKLAQ